MLVFDPPVLAHRGASAHAPENTMAAFTRAAQLGIQWIECDVMLAACGTPIIFHDETLDRTTNGHGPVGDHGYSWLSTLDAGSWFSSGFIGERIPTLEQLAEFLAGNGLRANIEIKPLPGQDVPTVEAALAVLSRYFPQPHADILWSSFSLPVLRHLRACSPQCYLGMLMHEWQPGWRTVTDALQCSTVHVNHDVLTAERVQEIKAAGKQLLAYTVNDADHASRLFAWGVDAVFSDYPDRIARFG